MNSQQSFIFEKSGAQRRDAGMRSVLSKTPNDYKQKFIKAIEDFPAGRSFTVEDVREIAGEPPAETHFNCMGALTRTAACRGLMRKTGTFVKAKRPSLHSSELALWVRL